MKKTKKHISFLVILSAIALSVTCSFAMKVQSVQRAQTSQSAVGVEGVEAVYLLRWDDRILSTSKGNIFLTNNVKIINKTGLDPDELFLQDNSPIVRLVKESDQIIEIIILLNPK